MEALDGPEAGSQEVSFRQAIQAWLTVRNRRKGFS